MTTLNIIRKEQPIMRVELESTTGRAVSIRAGVRNAGKFVIGVTERDGSPKHNMVVSPQQARDFFKASMDVLSGTGDYRVGHATVRSSAPTKALLNSSNTSRYLALTVSNTYSGDFVFSVGDDNGNKAAGFIVTKAQAKSFIDAAVSFVNTSR